MKRVGADYHRVLGLGLVLIVAAILLFFFLADEAQAAQPAPPSTWQVTHRMGSATTRMLDQRGLRVVGVVSASCRPGTRSDPTRRVRWWCLLEQRDEFGEVVWRSRVRLRWHRGRVRTSVTMRMEGVVQMQAPASGYLSSERF